MCRVSLVCGRKFLNGMAPQMGDRDRFGEAKISGTP